MVYRKMSMIKVLYLSYDGMTDPLGQSQVLPYLVSLSSKGYQFTILSFEKKERFRKEKKTIEDIVNKAGIKWVSLGFTSKPPMLSKFYDVIRMRITAYRLHKKSRFDMVHCRSYIAADIGLAMKKRFGIKFLFDMRGFWADEKKDAGSWNLKNPIFRRVYNYYKKKETEYLNNADYIISLTEAGKKEMLTWNSYDKKVPIEVIPCCADMSVFSLTSMEDKFKGRKLLNINGNRLVISYLGSIGAWYMLDEMLEMFRYIKLANPGALFLFITHSKPELIQKRLSAYSINPDDVKIVEASRTEVPQFVKASDINISFIKAAYSKISSSPTKLAEVLAMGIPVICNAGVGDVEQIVTRANAGIVIKDFTPEEYKNVVKHIPELLRADATSIRNNICNLFSLEYGVTLYSNTYQKVLEVF
jgi:glycosyltransferase involved in cell wall biosynthesis